LQKVVAKTSGKLQATIAGSTYARDPGGFAMSRTRRRPYPSDLSDAEWALLEPLLASPERRGRPPKWSARRIADAVFYLLRSGCAWRMLPREYPPWQTVYYHFRKWRRDGRLRQAHDRLRATVRESEGKDRDPSGAVLDSQVARTTGVGGPERGYDGAKRLAGRKRHLLVDTGGLVLGVHVHTASLHDRDGGRELLSDESCRGNCPGWPSSGRTPPTPAGFESG
jgi:putative transposase